MAEKSTLPNPNAYTPRRLRGRHAVALGAAAVVLGSQSFSSCTSPDTGDTGGGVTKPIASVVKTYPGGDSRIYLDCTDVYTKTKDGEIVPDPDKAFPRVVDFESSPGVTWAGQVSVEYGHVTRDENGDQIKKLSNVTVYPFWVAEKNTGEAATTMYASHNGALPESNNTWINELQLPVGLEQNGTLLKYVGANPNGGTMRVAVGKISPYFVEDVHGEPLEVHDTGTLAVQCSDAENYKPTDLLDYKYYQVATVAVPASFETVPPLQD